MSDKEKDLAEEQIEEKDLDQNTETDEQATAASEEDISSTETKNAEIEDLKHALEEKEDAYLRLQAELANIQKRNRKEREDAAKYRSQSLAKELLPVIDNLERALMIEVDDEQGKSLKAGLEMVMESFKTALINEGIEVIDPLHEPFDPNFHQAVQTIPTEEDQEADTVVMVHQKGYALHGRVLRPAMVAVAQ